MSIPPIKKTNNLENASLYFEFKTAFYLFRIIKVLNDDSLKYILVSGFINILLLFKLLMGKGVYGKLLVICFI